ncbi:uncharacterized protein LOC100205763 isoform X1 [Hydra vulgaris]|uniref:Uncharacterized protein LOC100205763 isoform X1 n=1 Tax=Hydra vulgaris TaxID=6087 RepID=A0ABM4CYE6_HYDVU
MFEGQNIHLSPIDGKKLCSFSKKLCKQRRLNGYAFCVRHILEDSKAPFKQCVYKTKTNGERCINSVPIALDRVYCMNHLQVLGLAPKKPITKPVIKPAIPTCNKKKPTESSKNFSLSQEKHTDKMNSVIHPNRKTVIKVGKKIYKSKIKDTEAVNKINNAPYKIDIWRDTLNKEAHAIILDYVKSCNTKILESNDMGFHSIKDSSDCALESNIFQQELLFTKDKVYHNTLVSDSLSVQEEKLLQKLKHQYNQLKKVIISKNENLSYTKLSKLILAARSDVVQLANVLNTEDSTRKLFRNHSKITRYKIPCSLITGSNQCFNSSLPFTKFCKQHLHHDDQQKLFTKCYDKHINRAKCPGSKLNIFQDQHVLVKKKKKMLKPRKSKLNENESDLNKTEENLSDLNESFSSETSSDSYTSSSESEEDVEGGDGDSSASEDAFHLPPASLSFANGCRMDEDENLFRNGNCELDDEDDELMCCSNEFSFNSKVPRELSSPTLNQLSTSDFDVSFNTLMDSAQSLENESNAMPGSFLSYEHPENEHSTPQSHLLNKKLRIITKNPLAYNAAEKTKNIYMKNNELKNTSAIRVLKRKQDFNHRSSSVITKPIQVENFNKRFLGESINIMTPLCHDKNIFDVTHTEVSSPLEKVNPDIFFSSVFPLTSDKC